MTSTSPTPDISSLSLNAQPSQQRPHDSYDYDGLSGANLRQQYHFSTSPIVPGQMPYNPLNVSQSSPLKPKPAGRAGLPSVRTLLRSLHGQTTFRTHLLPSLLFSSSPFFFPPSSNGWIRRRQSQTQDQCPLLQTLIYPQGAHHPWVTSLLPSSPQELLPHQANPVMMRLYQLRLSSRISHSTSNAKLYSTSSCVSHFVSVVYSCPLADASPHCLR